MDKRFTDAIKRIDDLCKIIDKSYKETLELAIDALDKQNPMEVMEVEKRNYCVRCVAKHGFEIDRNIVTRNYLYCPICGQKLDWWNYDERFR